MQQDNNIRNKLRELEKQQLPDLSQMEEHWQQMQASLPPAISAGAKVININRWVWIVTSAVLIIAGILFFNHHTSKNENDPFQTIVANATPTNNVVIPSANTVTLFDTLKPLSNPMGVIDIMVKRASLIRTFTGMKIKSKEFKSYNRKDTMLSETDSTPLLKPIYSLVVSNKVDSTEPNLEKSELRRKKILNPGQYENVGKQITKAEVKVFDLRNRPFKIEQTEKGKIGYFVVTDDTKISRSELKSILKEKYGYYKIKFCNSWRNHFIQPTTDSLNYSENPIGDTVWIGKAEAEKYKLQILDNRNRTYTVKNWQFVPSTDSIEVIDKR